MLNMSRKINLHLLKQSVKLRKVSVSAERRIFCNLSVFRAQVYVHPQNPWHKRDAKVLEYKELNIGRYGMHFIKQTKVVMKKLLDGFYAT